MTKPATDPPQPSEQGSDCESPDEQTRSSQTRLPNANGLTESPRQQLEQVYRDHSRELWARFYALCSDPERATDAVQEAFTRLASQLTPIDPEHSQGASSPPNATPEHPPVDSSPTTPAEPIRDWKAWLIRVGQNWLRDVARRKDQNNRQVERLDSYPHPRVGSPEIGPLAEMLRDERHGLVREAMSRLRDEDREVLTMRYTLAWSSKQIAETLESSASAIDMRLSRARRRLADILAELGVTPQS